MFIKAVEPYIYPEQLNFKNKPFEAWSKTLSSSPYLGREFGVVAGCYPKWLHGLWFLYDLLPTLWQSKTEARLIFVQPVSLYFDAGFSVLTHEVIPLIWDCWEQYDGKVVKWMKRHRVKRAIFTSEISAKRIKAMLPNLDILVITEGIDIENYPAGKELKDRTMSVFNYGRMPKWAAGAAGFKVLDSFKVSELEFAENLQNAKVTVAVPRCDVDPSCHETLTQRYWEAMLSRMVMVGRAPKELIDLIGYDPVVPMSDDGLELNDVLSHIEDYQELVDKNRETALRMGGWETRIVKIQQWLQH